MASVFARIPPTPAGALAAIAVETLTWPSAQTSSSLSGRGLTATSDTGVRILPAGEPAVEPVVHCGSEWACEAVSLGGLGHRDAIAGAGDLIEPLRLGERFASALDGKEVESCRAQERRPGHAQGEQSRVVDPLADEAEDVLLGVGGRVLLASGCPSGAGAW